MGGEEMELGWITFCTFADLQQGIRNIFSLTYLFLKEEEK